MLISSLHLDFRTGRNGYSGNASWLCRGHAPATGLLKAIKRFREM
jgi:hypothetical protein